MFNLFRSQKFIICICSMSESDVADANIKDKNGWEEIVSSEQILESLRTMGFKSPTAIQQAIIPQATKLNKDIIGAAETGSGKTLAFAIPIMERWLADGRQNLSKEEVKLFAIIIAPTRELAIQIKDVFKQLSIKTGPSRTMHTISIVGGMSEQKQQRLLKTRPDIVVATPGRLWALKQTGEEHLDDLTGMEMLVVDEIDRMLEQGHFEELKHIVQDIHRSKKAQMDDGIFQLQTLIFSATLTFTHHIPVKKREKSAQQQPATGDPKQKVRRIAQAMWMRKGASKLAVVDLTPAQKTPKTLIECRMHCADLLQKDTNLFYLLQRYVGRTLVFGNSVSAIRRLRALLRKLMPPNGPLPRILHGRMKEKERLKNLEQFEASPNSILLATDVAARGLDFHSVQNIIHYQAPKTTENYIHRSGRTARASKAGLSVLFVDPLDLHNYQKICRNMNRKEDLELLAVDDEKLMQSCRKMVELGTEVESLEHRMKKRKSKEEWFRQMAEKADLVWEEEGDWDEQEEGEGQKMERRKKMAERTLKEMVKNWIIIERKPKNGEGKMEDEENGQMRKRLRLEKGAKKWFKRPKIESIPPP